MIHDLAFASLPSDTTPSSCDGCSIHRHGLRFEKSGDSMAVFDGEHRLDRITLRDAGEQSFAHAVDMWLLNRYMAEAA